MNLLPNLKELGQNFVIALHDAGAANLLIPWLKLSSDIRMEPWVSGPARLLWEEAFPKLINLQKVGLFHGVDGLICGTGWQSTLEFDAMKIALDMGLPVYAVLDHWVNYEERFTRQGISVLPTEIWVSDKYAESKASSIFPTTKIQQYENLYLKNQVAQIKDLDSSCSKELKRKILYIAEPIRSKWIGFEKTPGEFQALDYFLSMLSTLNIEDNFEIRIRRHPSERIDKYSDWILRNFSSEMPIFMDQFDCLSQSIAWSNMVVGCHSFGMVVALEAGRPVFSSIPPWGGDMVLPFKEIIRISEI